MQEIEDTGDSRKGVFCFYLQSKIYQYTIITTLVVFNI